jgi:O-antigen ligase
MVAGALLLALFVGVMCALRNYEFPAAILGLILLIPCLTRPKLLLQVGVFLAPLNWLPLIPMALVETAKDILLLTLFVSVIIAVVTRTIAFKLPANSLAIPLLVLFLIALAAGVIFSSTPLTSLMWWLKAMQPVVFFVILLIILDIKDTKKCLVLFALGHLLSVCYLWFEVVVNRVGIVPPWEIPYSYVFRGDGGLSYRRTAFSMIGAFVLPVLVVWFFDARKRNNKSQYLFTAASCLLVFGSIVVSHGRGGLVAAIVSLLFLLWNSRKKTTIAAVFCALLILWGNPHVVSSTFLNAGSNVEQWLAESGSSLQYLDRWTGYRLRSYLGAVDLAISNPAGVGLGNYREVATASEFQLRYANYGDIDGTIASSAHNLYLSVASEAGLGSFFVLFMFTCWYFMLIKRALKENQYQNLVFMAGGTLIACFVASLVEVEIIWPFMTSIPFWLGLSALTLLINASRTTSPINAILEKRAD